MKKFSYRESLGYTIEVEITESKIGIHWIEAQMTESKAERGPQNKPKVLKNLELQQKSVQTETRL